MKVAYFALMGIVFLSYPAAVEGVILYVDIEADGSNNGLSWDDAFTDLQSALLYEEDPEDPIEEIRVAEGTYRPHASSRDVPFYLLAGVTLQGGYPTEGAEEPSPGIYPTILSGDLNDDDGPGVWENYDENSYHVVRWPRIPEPASPPPVLDGFYIEGGYANAESGIDSVAAGMFCGATITIRNCVFQDNWARGVAGGIHFEGYWSEPSVEDCQFLRNSAYDGGGVHNGPGADVTITGCTFSENEANFGAGFYNSSGGADLLNCIFKDNVAQSTITRSSLTSNGGAMHVGFAPITAKNCLFSQNLADDHGGGIYNWDSLLTLVNCTFYDNKASQGGDPGGRGGGIWMYVNTTMTNCIFWDNDDQDGTDLSAQIHVESGTPTVSYSCIYDGTPGESPYPFGGSSNHNIDDDPDFMSPPADLHLDYMYCYSPCINAGNNGAISGVDEDLDGNDRIVHSTVDMGPYEVQVELGYCCTEELEDPPVCYGDANGDGTVDPQDVGLVKYYYGSTEDEALCRYDVNCDGTINPQDVGLVKYNYGDCAPQSPPPCYEEY
jgi:hypothetical protein